MYTCGFMHLAASIWWWAISSRLDSLPPLRHLCFCFPSFSLCSSFNLLFLPVVLHYTHWYSFCLDKKSYQIQVETARLLLKKPTHYFGGSATSGCSSSVGATNDHLQLPHARFVSSCCLIPSSHYTRHFEMYFFGSFDFPFTQACSQDTGLRAWIYLP